MNVRDKKYTKIKGKRETTLPSAGPSSLREHTEYKRQPPIRSGSVRKLANYHNRPIVSQPSIRQT